MKLKHTVKEIKEPRPPTCICCEYIHICEQDRENGQKVDYCPDRHMILFMLNNRNGETK